jgi:hypothetical protein
LITENFSFLDYIFGGCEISMQVAVDFTLSNGDINSPDSLHDLTEKNNQYIKAIMGIGNIL